MTLALGNGAAAERRNRVVDPGVEDGDRLARSGEPLGVRLIAVDQDLTVLRARLHRLLRAVQRDPGDVGPRRERFQAGGRGAAGDHREALVELSRLEILRRHLGRDLLLSRDALEPARRFAFRIGVNEKGPRRGRSVRNADDHAHGRAGVAIDLPKQPGRHPRGSGQGLTRGGQRVPPGRLWRKGINLRCMLPSEKDRPEPPSVREEEQGRDPVIPNGGAMPREEASGLSYSNVDARGFRRLPRGPKTR